MTVQLTNAAWLASVALAEALEPPPEVDYLAWAVDNIVFTGRESPLPGPYNPAAFPYFSEVLHALNPADPCRFVSLLGSAQIGKTVLANVFTLGTLAMDPGDLLYVHPTLENAARWSKTKLSPMLRNTTALSRLFPQKSRDGSDAILYKERADGRGAILISGANSPASLSLVSMKRQVQDDLSKWEKNDGGDPEQQADSRSQAYEFAKIFKIGTPLVEPGCRITRAYQSGSQERPFVPCPHCDAMQVLEWDNMLSNLEEAHPDRAHFTCVECGCEIHEHDRPQFLKKLEWRAAVPELRRVHRSFWIWSAYSLLQSFERIARRWFEAKGDPAAEQTFLNDVVGLAYKAQGESIPWEDLRDRAAASWYIKGTIPRGGLLLTIGVDCQVDRVEYQVVAWGRDLRRWTVDYGVLPGHISEAKCQDALAGMLKQTWRNAAGQQIACDLMAIDGNAWTEDVWAFAQRHPASKVIMVRGVGAETAPLLARVKRERGRDGTVRRYSRRFYNFATSVLKMALYRNLAKDDPLDRSFIGLPSGLEDDYFRQLTSERRKAVLRRGFTVYQWEKDPNQANEALDTALQAEAAAIKLGVRSLPDTVWAHLEDERETPPVQLGEQLDLEDLPLMSAPATAAAEPPPKPRPKRRLA